MLTDAHVHFFPELLTHTPPLPGWDPRQIHLNTTREADWDAVAQVTRRAPSVAGFPEVVPYFGIHPWFVAGLSDGWEDRLAAMLDQFPAAGVGEIGLDALRADLDRQKKVFLAQLELARSLKRPVSVHCVRAWEWVEPLIQRTVGPAGLPILLHGFNGSADQALHFLEGLGWNVSFSLTSLRTRLNSPKTRALLDRLPPDRVLMETDAETLDQTRGFREFCQAVETLRTKASPKAADR